MRVLYMFSLLIDNKSFKKTLNFLIVFTLRMSLHKEFQSSIPVYRLHFWGIALLFIGVVALLR